MHTKGRRFPPPERLLSRLWLALALALALALPSSARADDVADEADHLFSLGTERYAAADYKGALQYFLASNRLVRNRNVMFNIARTYEHLRDYPDAYRYYQRAGEGETDTGTKQRIRDALSRLAPSVALLEVKTEPPGASIYLNRKDLGDRGTAPQTIAMPPGQYVVIAELAGHQDAISPAIDLRVGSERTVTLKLVRVVGTVRVTGVAGAQVRLDTDDAPAICEVPCDAPAPPGQHTLIVTKPGYRPGRFAVQVRANGLSPLRADLEAETGSVVVNADEREALIEIDGKTQGFTPAVLQVAAGKHTVRVSLRGFRPITRAIEVKANEQTKLDLELVTADSVETASRLAEPIDDAPASVTLIPSPELRGMRYPTVAEAVRGIRGTFTSDDRNYKTVGFRGFSRPGDYGNRVLVLIDGQPTNDNWLWSSYVGYDLRTDLEDVDHVEVVRGPGSVLYGTGAFSGVVNLVSNYKDAPDGREVTVSVADEGVARARARVTHHFDKDFGVWTSIAGGKSAGNDYYFPEYAAQGPPSAAGWARDVDGFQVGTVMGRLFYKWASVQWFANTHNKHQPTKDSQLLLGDTRFQQSDTRAFVEAKVEPTIGDMVTSTSRVHWNYYGFRAHRPHTPADGGLGRTSYDGSWIGAEQRFVVTPLRELRLTGGGEAQDHFLAHERDATELEGTLSEQRQTFTLFAGYAMADLTPTPNLKVSAAARLDSYSTSGASINPRLAVIVKPYEGGNVKILAGKAFRAPSIYELYSTGGGLLSNPNLKPENMYSAEVEYGHHFTRTVSLTLSSYANYITNLIAVRDVDPTAPVPTYDYENTNVPVATLGAEAEVRREWKEGWMVGASYSLQSSRYLASGSLGDLLSLQRASGLREVPNAPGHIASVRGGLPILGRALLLMNRLTIEGPRYDREDVDSPTSPPQTKTSGALLWDVVFSGGEPRWGLAYSLGVYNAFDARWSVPVSSEFRQSRIPQNGRTLLALGSITF